VGQTSGGSNDGVSKSSISKSSVSKTVISSISQTMSISESVRISVGTIESSGISLRFSISIALAISYGSIWVARIGQGSSGTWHGYISTVHTGGRLATEGMETIRKGGGQELGLSLAVHGSNKGRCNNKELIHFVKMIQL